MVIACSIFIIPFVSIAHIIYVDQAVAVAGDGSSWQKAYRNLQSALKGAQPEDQVWVAKGSYYPSSSKSQTSSFVIPSGVTVLGGFSGTEQFSQQRNFTKNLTILDGDIKHHHIPETYSQHVLILNHHSLIDGFTIEHGYSIPIQAKRSTENRTTLIAITQNHLDSSGAGILNAGKNALVRNCTIQDNIALRGAGSYNTGSNATPIYINDTFKRNIALLLGGAMANALQAKVILINCKFINNHCYDTGGAIYNDLTSSILMLNGLIAYNHADRAAAIGNSGGSKSILIYSTIKKNVADSIGPALYQGSYNVNLPHAYNQMLLINSIVTQNRSLSNGPTLFIWGENDYTFYNSQVPYWPQNPESAIPPDYQKLAAIAKAIKKTPLSPSQLEFIENFITSFSSESTKKTPAIKEPDAIVNKHFEFPKRRYFVNKNSTCKHPDGLSWKTAYPDLQRTINQLSQAGGGEIWIATGTYYPKINTKEKEFSSFKLRDNIALYGGFSGDETMLNQRDIQNNKVILSGYIGKTLKKPNHIHAYHVVIGAKHCLIDGLTIEEGLAKGIKNNAYGGGLLMIGNNQTVNVQHTTFRNNEAYYGGAVYAFNKVSSYFYDVNFIQNKAAMGGGLYLSFGSNLFFEKGSMSLNVARYRGGAIVVNHGANPILSAIRFDHNRTQGNGGALWIDNQTSQFTETQAYTKNCLWDSNIAQFYGGAIAVVNKGKLIQENSKFKNNRARTYDNIYQEKNTLVTDSLKSEW